MNKLECIIFNVDHGFCAFVKSPNDYGLIIDCAGRSDFSPIKWVRQNYNSGNGNIKYFEGRRIAMAIITHLHSDHFSDVGAFELFDKKPKRLVRDKKTLKLLDKKIQEETDEQRKTILTKFKEFQKSYDTDPESTIEWGFDYFDWEQISFDEAETISENDDRLINNRSYFIAIKYSGHKILFPGDIEIEGWEQALREEKIRKVLLNTSFFVASHHGHKSGFTTKILEYSGIPYIYIISARSGDEQIDSSYSKEYNSKGYLIKGDTGESKLISTKRRNKSIRLTIFENGSTSIEPFETLDNLNENQKKKLARRSKKIIDSWGIKY